MKKQREKENNYEKGITLIALVVTIIVLIILAGVSINMLVGENGIINMAQRAKNETEQAAKDEQQALAGMIGKSYADYNGQLHVEGTDIVNQYGEIIQLRGLSTGNGRGRDSLTEKYYNKESLSNIKKWGANIFRIAVDTSPNMHGYLEDSEIVQDVYRIADICIDLDMYVIIDWHVLSESDPNVYKEEAKDFFEQVVTRYKDVPNVLYEICNEPSTTWDNIYNYANEIIPLIRNISNKAIIITGTPSYSKDLSSIQNKKLAYDNVMYTYHMYVQNLTSNRLDEIENAINNGIPVFVTEWGTSSLDSTGTFFLEYSNLFVEFAKEHKLSWCNWNLTDANELLAVVKYNQWNNSLTEDILTESGLYIKGVLEGTIDTSSTIVLMDYDANYAFWQEDYREKITNIIVENSINSSSISNAIQSWDVSFTNGLENVIAYIEDDGLGTGTYTLHISANGKICAPLDSSNMFRDFVEVSKIDIKGIEFSNTRSMAFMFRGCEKLIDLDLSSFNTSNVTDMMGMFTGCTSIKNLDLSSFNTSKVGKMHQMFAYCSNLETLDLSNFNYDNVSIIYQMFAYDTNLSSIKFGNSFSSDKVEDLRELFYKCESLKELDLSMFNTSNVKNMSAMFASCEKLEKIDLSNFDTSNVENMANMFDRCRQLVNLDLSSFNIDKVQNIDYMFRDLNNIENLKLNNMNFDNVTSYTDMFTRAKTDLKIIVKDEDAKAFIENRLNDVSITGNVSIEGQNM